MTIQEIEKHTGLSRSNIRFYEKEGLIAPGRTSNSYRDYSENDLAEIKKIAYLRTLGISIRDISKIINGAIPLPAIVSKQAKRLDSQIGELEDARYLCNSMLQDNTLSYDTLNVDEYVDKLPDHISKNRKMLQPDAVSFISLWGGVLVWTVLTVCSFVTALIALSILPPRIPVQWKDGAIASEADKIFIFAYPLACMLIRLFLRPVINNWLYSRMLLSGNTFSDYITNFLCFVALSMELFTILFTSGILKNVLVILALDGIVFLGIFLTGLYQLQKDHTPEAGSFFR